MTEDAIQILKEIEIAIPKNDNVDFFVDKIHQLVSISPISFASKFNKGVNLYRATNHHKSIPERIEELWFPPLESASLSRANRKGNPMFYCTSDPACAFLELGIKPEQLAVHSEWATMENMLIHDLGYVQKTFDRAGASRILPEEHQKFEKSDLTNEQEYIHFAFTEPTSSKYSLTAAIAEVYLRGDDFSGIRYPAITKKANVDNFALLPEFVKKYMKLKSAQLVSIVEILDTTFRYEVIADLILVDQDGSLSWSFKNKGRNLEPNESCTIEAGIITMQTDGQILINGEYYLVKPGYTIQLTTDSEVIVRNLRGEKIASESHK